VGRRKVTERKIDNTHLLESGKVSHKSDEQIGGKRNRKQRKNGGKSARRRKVTERWAIYIY
jgi:hypothetical protein